MTFLSFFNGRRYLRSLWTGKSDVGVFQRAPVVTNIFHSCWATTAPETCGFCPKAFFFWFLWFTFRKQMSKMAAGRYCVRDWDVLLCKFSVLMLFSALLLAVLPSWIAETENWGDVFFSSCDYFESVGSTLSGMFWGKLESMVADLPYHF